MKGRNGLGMIYVFILVEKKDFQENKKHKLQQFAFGLLPKKNKKSSSVLPSHSIL